MIKSVVWDIGGVLLEDVKVGDLWKDSKGGDKLREAFGSGELSVEEFVNEASKLLGISKEDFLRKYKKIYFDVFPIDNVIELYNLVKTNNYILSDTNPIHMKFIKENFPQIFSRAKKSYFSPKIGLRKSSKEVFEYLVKDLNLFPEEILLIDNKEKIVELAKSVGLNVIHFTDTKKLNQDLNKFGVK